MTIFENVYDVLFQPRTALRRIAGERPLAQAVLVFLMSVLIPVIPMYFTMHFAAGILTGAQLTISLTMWFLGAAVWGLLAELFGGTGQSSSLFTALGFAHIPRIFLVPGLMAVSIMPSSIRSFFEIILITGVLVWSLILDVTAIRETYGLSGAKASLVLLAPLLIILIIMVLTVITAGTMMMQLPFSLENVLVE